MTWVAVVLIGIGVGDLAQASNQRRGAWTTYLVTPGGLGLFNIATGNVIVRLVLLATGAMQPDQVTNTPTPQPSDRLKGGRLLGPMERLVILGLGLAGEFGAAGLVIAAKGLLRFPEIQASARSNGTGGATMAPVGIDDVTEYFLVGSFTSWLVAFVCLAAAV